MRKAVLAPVRAQPAETGRYNQREIKRNENGRRNAKSRARARQGAQPDERPVRHN